MQEQASQIHSNNSKSASSESAEDCFVPVVPALSNAFYRLQLIDEFRQTNSENAILELLNEVDSAQKSSV